MRSLAGCLFLALLAACSSEAPPAVAAVARPAAGQPIEVAARETISIAAAATKMLPRDAVAVVHVSSPAMVLHRIAEAGALFSPLAGAFVSDALVLSPLGLRKNDVDLTGDAAMVLQLGEKGAVPTIAIPSKKPDDAVLAAAMEAVADGDYVVMAPTKEPEPRAGALPMAQKMLAGDVSVRVDLKALVAKYRDTLTPYLDAKNLAKLDPSGQAAQTANLQPLLDRVKAELDKVETLDLALSFRDGWVELDVVVGMNESVWPAAEPDFALLQALPLQDADQLFYMQLDWKRNAAWLSPIVEQSPLLQSTGAASELHQLLQSSVPKFGKEVAAAIRSDARDGVMFFLGRGGDPTGFQTAFADGFGRAREAIAADPKRGASLDELPGREVAGVSFRTFRIDLPVGGNRVVRTQYCVGGAADRVFVTTPNALGAVEHASAAVEKKERFDNPVLARVKDLRVTPRMFLAVDLRGVMRAQAAAVGRSIPEGEPILAWFAVGGAGKRVEVQFKMAILEFGKLMQAMRKRR